MSNLLAKGLSFAYDKKLVLKDVSLELKPGTLTALVGPNGAGKSTLLRLLEGHSCPNRGEIFLNDLPLRVSRHQIALMPQRSSINWNFPITVKNLVALGKINIDNQSCCDIEASLQRVGISSLANYRLDKLSGGQQQRALLAKNISSKRICFPFG